MINDDTIKKMEILSELCLSEEEKEYAKKDMSNIIEFVDKLKELDTLEVEPMLDIFERVNVFRDDIVRNINDREKILKNAPNVMSGRFVVPKTIE